MEKQIMGNQSLAIVTPIFNEEDVLPELFRRLSQVCDSLEGIDWKVIFVNDGSRDRSLQMILEKHVEDSRFTAVDLSRNFGHQAAISAGLAHVDEDAVVIMDGDLQDPPEVIPMLVSSWKKGGKVVLAFRRSRPERGIRRIGFEVFHWLFNWMSDLPIEDHSGVFSLLDREAVVAFNGLPERNRYIPGLRAWIGFEQMVVYYDRSGRQAGHPKQTLRRLIGDAINGLVSFSWVPLRMMVGLGMIISTFGFVIGSIFIIKRLAGLETAETGFTTLVTLVLFLGGIQLLAIGVLGEYLGRIYDETKQRPLYLVKGRFGLGQSQTTETPP